MLVTVRVDLDDDADANELEAAIRSLRTELEETRVEVRQSLDDTPPPAGAKGALNAGNVLFLAGQAVAFEVVADTLVDWVRRRRRSTKLRIEGPNGELLELPDTTPVEVRRLLLAWALGNDDPSSADPATS